MNTKVKLGLIGCGEVTRAKHLPALARCPSVSVVAACDIDRDACARVARQFGIARQFDDVEALLASTDIDAAGICMPPAHHAEIAIAALRAGKHVWIDKPLTLDAPSALRIITAVGETGLVAMTGFHMRFHRLVSEARALIRSGDLGALESARVVWHSPRDDRGIPLWKTRRSEGGGALTEIAVHHFDLLRFLLDSEIEEISASTANGVRDDECSVIAGRMSNGVLFSGEFSERSAHEIEIVVAGHDRILRLDCLRFDGLELRETREPPGSPSLRVRAAAHFARSLPYGIRTLRRGGDYRISYEGAWAHFCDAILRGTPLQSTLEDGLRAVYAVSAAVESSLRGSRVPVEPVAPASPHSQSNPLPKPEKTADTTRPIFSVVIPTYNRRDQLPGVLDALARQDLPREQFEVILIDDGGCVPVDEIVPSYNSRLQLTLVKRSHGGCAAARQTGIDLANGAFLAFTDDDCRPAADWLSRMQQHFLAHPLCAVAGPTVNALGRNAYSEASQIVVSILCSAGSDAVGMIRFAPTSNIAFPAAQLSAVGGLQRAWRLAGGEDRDLCARWWKAGFQIRFDPACKVYHEHRLSASSFALQHFRYGRGAWIFHRRTLPALGQSTRLYERLRFHAALLAAPFYAACTCNRFRLALALLLSQAATVAGFVTEGTLSAGYALGLLSPKEQISGTWSTPPNHR